MRRALVLAWMAPLVAAALSSTAAAADEATVDILPPPPLALAYPPPQARLPAITSVICLGAIDATNGTVTINGCATDVYPTGAFLVRVPLVPGTNTLVASWCTNTLVRRVTVAAGEPFTPSAARDKSAPPPPSSSVRNPYADLGIPPDTVFPPSPPRHKSPREMVIMLDPGHGGADCGAFSPHGLPEKDINLIVARAVRDQLRAYGFDVRLTRDEDVAVPLYDRPRRAWREGVDAFISIHHNATAPQTDPRAVRHVTTYASNVRGLPLARAIQRHLARAVPDVRDAGAQLKSLAVCRNPAVASCLLEVDFINLPEGEEASWDPARPARVAHAVVCGLLDWYWGK